MPEQRVARAGAQNEEESSTVSTIRQIANGLLMFFAIQMVMKYITGSGQQQVTVDSTGAKIPVPTAGSYETARTAPQDVDSYAHIPEHVAPIWPLGTNLDMSIYLSESLLLPPLSSPQMKNQLVFHEKKVQFGDWDEKRSASMNVTFSPAVQNNGTLFAHIFVGKTGAVLDPTDREYDPAAAFRMVKLLNRYMPKKKVVKTKKLIGGSEEEEEEVPEVDTKAPAIASYWHSNLTLDLVTDEKVLQYRGLPAPVAQHIVLEQTGARDKSGKNGWYYPIIFVNDFWNLKDHMVEINSTVSSLPLHINLGPTVFWKFQIYASLDASFKQAATNPGLGQTASTGQELEEFKRILIDTNIYLLGTTFFVSILHTIFEMLAFKNDISHWRNKKDNVGVSVRTILANVFMQSVIFLYLLDNSEGTSWMIMFGQGMGIVLEAWKITRTVDVKVLPAAPGSWLPYKISFEDKHKLSALEKETQRYDREAFDYMKWIMAPLLLAYAAYSLLYETHKSWYSFVIATLVGSVYAYGFLMMVPSLYINYKLKSVAHMPRKTMIYKLLNTFIDDLFAFTIKMPTLHRLATLRDDVIYFIALYQSWIYRVDYRRINEFGQGGGEETTEGVDDVELLKEAERLAQGKGKGNEKSVAVGNEAEAQASAVDKKGGKKRR